MSTSAEPKKLFLVYAPDYSDPDALSRRLKVRQQHLEGVRPLIESGWSRVAGAMATEESLESGADKKFLGSTFIIKADSLEEVRKRMEADVYWTENVWDKERMVITGFLSATPL